MASHHYQEVLLKPQVAVLYADAGAAALVDAIRAWRDAYAPTAAYESLLAEHISAIQANTRILPEGRATVDVRISGKLYGKTDRYWYEATLLAGELRLQKITI